VIWSEVYQLGFWGMLAMLELQSVIVGLIVAAFVPRRGGALIRDVAVNAFVAMLITFFALLALSMLFGFVLLILAEA
jgi:hypothetical protein